MEKNEEKIPRDTFTTCVSVMPQVSVELFLETEDGVLLAKRNNKPTKGEWFWPGTRLYKGEELEEGARRVGREELGIEVELKELLGVYDHFWDEDAFEEVDSKHTVNVVFRATTDENLDEISLDSQHSDFKLVNSIEPELHEYVKEYMRDSGKFE